MQIFQTFFCRMNEPSYIKHTKLEILAALADQSNAYDIVTELTEYVNDIDEKLARKAIQAVGQIALSVKPAQLLVPCGICIRKARVCSTLAVIQTVGQTALSGLQHSCLHLSAVASAILSAN